MTAPVIERAKTPPTTPPTIAPVWPCPEVELEVPVLPLVGFEGVPASLLVELEVPVLPLVGFEGVPASLLVELEAGLDPEDVVEAEFVSKIVCSAGSAHDMGYLALLE
jgi:hypothetical protein